MGEAQFSNAIIRQILALVRYRGGSAAVQSVLARAGERRPAAVLEDLTGWSSAEETRSLLEAAAEELGGSAALREVASAWVRADGNPELLAVLRSMGSPAEILRLIAETAAKFSTVVSMDAVEVADDHAVVSAWGSDEFPRYPALCDFTAGMLAIPSLLFGLAASSVTEERCQSRVDPRCVYRVSWTGDPMVDAEQRAAYLEAELAHLGARFDALSNTAADLVSVHDIAELLERITVRAATAVRAPSYLLAVRLEDDGPLRIHHRGIPAEEVDARAAEVLKGATDEDPSRLVADIASQGRHYGRLAALYPPGRRFFPEERGVLASYARLAAVALDTAGALREARRQATTAGALLELAGRLAHARSRQEVVERLAEAVPTVVECDRCSVLLYDDDAQRLRLVATHGYPDGLAAALRGSTLQLTSPSLLRHLRTDGGYLLYTPATPDEQVAAMLRRTGTVALLVTPITARGRLFGVVTAGVVDDPGRITGQDALAERLRGLAGQAATAIENAELLDQVQHQALHDPLTGLPNVRLLEDRLGVALAHARRAGTTVAVLFCDLDHFKHVNDSLGHQTGDRVLQAAATRLLKAVRDGDTVARVGGDEFVVLLGGDAGTDAAARVADKVLGAFRAPFEVAGQQLFLTPSIGVAVAPDDGEGNTELLRAADAAMYEAKSAGRATWRTHTHSPSPQFSRLDLDTDLHSAIERGELDLYLQPVVSLLSGRLVGAEGLVRWQHPGRGLVRPDEFLPVAEETGFITHIDAWVMDATAAAAARWRARSLPTLRLALNVCERDLRHGVLPERVGRFLAVSGMAPGDLELEVTERMAASGGDWLTASLTDLAGLGVRLAVDDFGTGTSTLARLGQWAFDTIKVDRSFVRQIRHGRPAPLVAAVVALGHGLGVEVVAEGVETEAQRDLLGELGCDRAQGWLLGRPVPVAEFERLLEQEARLVSLRP